MQALSNDELLAILRAARASSARDWLMILLAYWHGLRASEVVKLTRDDVANGALDVRRLKGSKRTVQPLITHADPLKDEARGVIEYCGKWRNNQLLFPITRQHFWRLFQEYCERSQIPPHKRHPHVLKHTIALQVIHDAGIENTRQWLGHQSISSTGAYLKVSDESCAGPIIAAAGGLNPLKK